MVYTKFCCHLLLIIFLETMPPQMRRLTNLQTLIISDNPMVHAQLRSVSTRIINISNIFSKCHLISVMAYNNYIKGNRCSYLLQGITHFKVLFN